MSKAQHDANLIGWANTAVDVNLGSDEPVDSIAGVKANQLRGARKRLF
jgi:hypothetical protein